MKLLPTTARRVVAVAAAAVAGAGHFHRRLRRYLVRHGGHLGRLHLQVHRQ